MLKIDPALVSAVRGRLGTRYGELLTVMLDLDVPPIFLHADDRPRLARVRAQAMDLLNSWAKDDPAKFEGLLDGVPDILRATSPVEGLLEAAMWDEYFELPESIFVVQPRSESRALQPLPTLVDRIDDDGLLEVVGLDATPHGLRLGGFALHYHQLLRRDFRANIHYGLVNSILDFACQYNLKARIAIDERRQRFIDEYQECFEADHWFGRPLDERDLDSLSAVGETFYGDPHAGTSSLHPYAGLSIRWTVKDGLKTVQIEEFMPTPSADHNWVLARYLHAIRDVSKKAFVHCDGAVKAYDARAYPRSQQEFRDRGRGVHYRKVFRVDGEFPAPVWSTLLSDWFRGNRLVLEYLAQVGTR